MSSHVAEPVRIDPTVVLDELKKHILVDGFEIVIDLERSKGCTLYDAHGDREIIDMYSFYASMPIGFNHPYFDKEDVRNELADASMIKIANSDVYSVQMAEFVKTFDRVMGLPQLPRYFFIEGGALAVENAMKAAMDWKVRKNIAAGRGEIGTQILHFENAFHGRTGYTMSVTNTDPNKVKYYAKFDWPRVSTPHIDFSLDEPERTKAAEAAEKKAEAEIMKALADRPHQICAILLEPIQGEGGDRHFRHEWMQTLRRICDENELLLIFDEVQCGMGVTGARWAFETLCTIPDLVCFGKKAQVCGVMAGPKLDEVPENVFRTPSRINSTWGGNYTDMVRSKHFLNIIEQENLIENAKVVGDYFGEQLRKLHDEEPMIEETRGSGLLQAFSLKDGKFRDHFWKGCFEVGLLVVRSGPRSIRFRPVLDTTKEVIDEVMRLMREQIRRVHAEGY